MTNWYRRYCGDRIYFFVMQTFGKMVGDQEFNKGKGIKKWQFRLKMIGAVFLFVLLLFFLNFFMF